jgi:F0F1-type ATP synthase membrane subunit c/vacuolar-type H+-ATPase subunit K
LGEAGIWITVILAGMLALGVREYVRSSEDSTARWERVKFALMTAALIVLGIVATILSIGFIIAIVVVEIWPVLLGITLVVIALVGIYLWLIWPRHE